MIAIVTSTIFPPDKQTHGGERTAFSPKERAKQTIDSVKSLKKLGYEEVFVLDNSGERWEYKSDIFPEDVRLEIFRHYQFRNKGISEIYLILSALNVIQPKKMWQS